MPQTTTASDLSNGAPDLLIGIPTWDSERFLAPCLQQIAWAIRDIFVQITILDNGSTDAAQDIVRKHRCDVIVKKFSLPDALDDLLG